jgi:hypothetical protein
MRCQPIMATFLCSHSLVMFRKRMGTVAIYAFESVAEALSVR